MKSDRLEVIKITWSIDRLLIIFLLPFLLSRSFYSLSRFHQTFVVVNYKSPADEDDNEVAF